MRIGLISDTHGLLRPEAIEFLAGCDHILHGGDIGGAEILEALAAIAPVTAVRGNNDQVPWARDVPDAVLVHLGGVAIYVIHDLAQFDPSAVDAGVRCVVSGHSHKPCIEERDGILYVNPGSAGPRRFTLPVSAGRLEVGGGEVVAEVAELRHG